MNVYDFDKTIFYTDCSFLFIKWCLRKYPKLLVSYFPFILFYGLLYALKLTQKDVVEEKLFVFVPEIEELEREVLEFWDTYDHRISEWYLAQKRPDDLIISASPEFLIKPIAERLGVRFLATQLDLHTAKIVGISCYGRQKLHSVIANKYFPENVIESFYSDSLSDTPLALCAETAYFVRKKGARVHPWPRLTAKQKKKIMKKLSEDMTGIDEQ